jgi:hypothetical protein
MIEKSFGCGALEMSFRFQVSGVRFGEEKVE